MRVWYRLHVFIQILNVLGSLDCAFSITEVPQWIDAPETISSNGNLASSLKKRDETTLNSEESLVTEITSFSSITEVNPNDLDELSTLESMVEDTTESAIENLSSENHESDEEIQDSARVSSKFFDSVETDLDNAIDTSGDSLTHFTKEDNHGTFTDEPEPEVPEPEPECETIETKTTIYHRNYLKNIIKLSDKNDGPMNDNPGPKEEGAQVEDLEVLDTSPDSLTVSWLRPNGTVQVSYYLVQWKLDGEVESSCRVSNETHIHTIVINCLKSCKTYTVIVKPYFEVKDETEKLVTGTSREVRGTTGLDVHKDSLSLKVAANSTDWLKISWSMPGTDCLSHYVIRVCHAETNCSWVQVNTTTYNKTDLSPCFSYDFNLTVIGTTLESYGSTFLTGKTDFLTPGKPSETETIPGNNILDVSWREPIGHTCIDYYLVTWNRPGDSNNNTIQTVDTNIRLEDLKACAVYEISIVAVWNDGNNTGEPEIIRSNMTAPAVTDAPVKVGGPHITKNSISIMWQIKTNKENNCAGIKLTMVCNYKEVMGEGYLPKNGNAEFSIKEGTMDVIVEGTVNELSPYTSYMCHTHTENLGGSSEISLFVYAETFQDVPSAPEFLPAEDLQKNVTNTTIPLVWKRPIEIPGIMKSITIEVIWMSQFHRPPWCSHLQGGTDKITDINVTSTSYVYSAVPYSSYRIRMCASTAAGPGNASILEGLITNPGAPSQVYDLGYKMIESNVDPNILNVNVTWGVPCFINAPKIEYFYVEGSGKRDGFVEHNFTQVVNGNETTFENDTYHLILENLREEHTYDIQVATKVMNYDYLGDVSILKFDFPAGIPPEPDENYTSIISLDPFKARRTTTTATVLLPIFPDTSGTIRCYDIIVSQLGYNNGTFGRIDKNSPKPHVVSWIESKSQDFEIPYRAIQFCSDSFPSYIVDYGRLKAVKVVLGEDTETCPKLSLDRSEHSYCNGALKPDTWYHVRIRAYTDGGYRDSIVFTVKTNAELQVAVVIGTIFGILFLGIVTTTMLLVRKGSLQGVLRRFLHSDMPGSPVPAPFTRRKFVAHCQQLADNPGKLSNEFQLLQTLSVDLQMPTNAACLQANRKKNRYTDILPYDFSRVKLEVIDNDPNTDYINASFIKGFTGDEDYIACQGPKEETTHDFWRMIDQYDVKIIVMLTQLVEKNKEKCHQYFPVIRETFTYENLAIRCTTELDYRTYTHRTLVLQKENQKRSIIHLHFKDWPDHDVPEDFDPMINFCQIMRRHMEANRGLVVVHCSAGIGRTGTLIAIDILLQHIKENRKLDVFGTVYRLRHHRINMVQRESQYAYIYNCIKQVLKNPYFSKTYKPPSVDPIFDNNSHKKKEASDSSTNLVSSLETLKKSSFSTSVESAEPIYQTSSNSTSTSRACYPFNGLRCTKSTGAIDTRPCQELIGRCNTHDHPIFNIKDSAEIKSSDISFDITESEGSTTSLYENMQPLSRSKSAQAFGRNEDSSVTQKLLVHDTSL